MALLKPRATLRLGAGATALLVALIAGCFSPRQPACAFSCATPPHSCPARYTCADDGFCHRDDSTGECDLDDAGSDAGASGDAATNTPADQ